MYVCHIKHWFKWVWVLFCFFFIMPVWMFGAQINCLEILRQISTLTYKLLWFPCNTNPVQVVLKGALGPQWHYWTMVKGRAYQEVQWEGYLSWRNCTLALYPFTPECATVRHCHHSRLSLSSLYDTAQSSVPTDVCFPWLSKTMCCWIMLFKVGFGLFYPWPFGELKKFSYCIHENIC